MTWPLLSFFRREKTSKSDRGDAAPNTNIPSTHAVVSRSSEGADASEMQTDRGSRRVPWLDTDGTVIAFQNVAAPHHSPTHLNVRPLSSNYLHVTTPFLSAPVAASAAVDSPFFSTAHDQRIQQSTIACTSGCCVHVPRPVVPQAVSSSWPAGVGLYDNSIHPLPFPVHPAPGAIPSTFVPQADGQLHSAINHAPQMMNGAFRMVNGTLVLAHTAPQTEYSILQTANTMPQAPQALSGAAVPASTNNANTSMNTVAAAQTNVTVSTQNPIVVLPTNANAGTGSGTAVTANPASTTNIAAATPVASTTAAATTNVASTNKVPPQIMNKTLGPASDNAPTASNQSAKSLSSPKWDGWPSGTIDRLFTHDEVLATDTLLEHWVNQNSGSRVGSSSAADWKDGRKSTRRCQGIIECLNPECNFNVRPQTTNAGIEKQLQKSCLCGENLVHRECEARSFLFKFAGGTYYMHRGDHDHSRPSRKLHLTSAEHTELKDIVTNHPNTGPLGLIVGVPTVNGPGKSIADISTVLENQDRVKAERRRIKQEGHSNGDRFIRDFAAFDSDHPGFIINKEFGSVTVVSVQTPLMLSQLVKDSIMHTPVNGIVSDAAHGYWREHNSLLIVSSTYSPVLKRWIPGIISFSNGASAEHYTHHFYALFQSIAREARRRGFAIIDELFRGIMDFSEAERDGFIAAFILFWLNEESNMRTEEQLRDDAAKLIRGCREHFRAGVTRIARISAIVPPGKPAEEFQRRALALIDLENTEAFLREARAIIEDFPQVQPWLAWWMRPAHASMLFVSQRQMAPAIWDEIPETTNAEEAMHWKLYAGIGKHMSFFRGLEGLYSFGQYYNRLMAAKLGGNPVQYGVPEPWKVTKAKIGRTKPSRAPGKRKRYHNDGRAYDTANSLLRHAKKRKVRDDSDVESSQPAVDEKKTASDLFSKDLIGDENAAIPYQDANMADKRLVPSYPWKANSCWLDCSLEMLFNVVIRDYNSFASRFSDMQEDMHLYKVFEAMDQRYTLRTSELEDGVSYTPDLLGDQRDALRQHLIKNRFITQLKGLEDESKRGMDLAFNWLHSITRSQNDGANIFAQTYFETHLVRIRRCFGSTGASSDATHYRIKGTPQRHFYMEPMNVDHAQYKGSFARWLKDRYSIRKGSSSEPISCWRTDSETGEPLGCDAGCAEAWSACISVPVMLIVHVNTDMLAPSWEFAPSIHPVKVMNSDPERELLADQNPFNYDLVGRIFQRQSDGHFTARFTSGSRTSAVFEYNDLEKNGYARCITKGNVKTHLRGTDEKIDIPVGTRTAFVIYHLRGGTDAQTRISEHQCITAENVHHVRISYARFGNLPTIALDIPGTRQLADEERFWMANPYSTEYLDYKTTSQEVKKVSSDSEHEVQKVIGNIEGPKPKRASKKLKLKLQVDPQQSQLLLSFEPTGPKAVAAHNSSGPTITSLPADTITSPGRSSSPFPFDCRCGAEGDGHKLCIDEDAVECDSCKKWSHIACQRNGQASKLRAQQKFICDHCNPSSLLPLSLQNEKPKKRTSRKPRTKLINRLIAGKGALARHKDYFWPVRLIKKETENGQVHTSRWRVKWWRENVFGDSSPDPNALISESDITDELWNDVEMRRQIRLGQWIHASELANEEDILSDPEAYKYTEELDMILRPHIDILSALLRDDEDEHSEIPACNFVIKARQDQKAAAALRAGVIPHTGSLDIIEQAMVINWIYSNIPTAKQSLHHWVSNATNAHAITLVLASRHHEDILEQENYPRDQPSAQEVFILEAAWQYQLKPQAKTAGSDVDRECLYALEEGMFECSIEAGKAGNQQWGLDKGPHKNRWNPYAKLPYWWNHGDYIGDEEELEVGPEYVDEVEDGEDEAATSRPPSPLKNKQNKRQRSGKQ